MKLWFFMPKDMKLFDGRKMTKKLIRHDGMKLWDRQRMSPNIITALRFARGEILCQAEVEVDVGSYGDCYVPLSSKLISRFDASAPMKRYFDFCVSQFVDQHQIYCLSSQPYSDWFSLEDVSRAQYRLVLPNRLTDQQKSEVESWIINESVPI